MTQIKWIFGLTALLGCRSYDKPSNNDETISINDADGDGFNNDIDCDDDNPSIYPDALEICDEVDNDCDGDIDEDVLTTFYSDNDDDGFGSENSTTEACEAPNGFVDNADDCDDDNAAVAPGLVEICDNIDNDCDDVIDNDLIETWYLDVDEDGFGDAEVSEETCAPQSNYVLNALDCDDRNAAVYPDAPEICDNLDNNCNGTTDEDEAIDVITWYIDQDNDGYGDPSNDWISCEAPEGYVDNALDCDDSVSHVHPAAPEVCDGLDNDCDGVLPNAESDVDGDGHVECDPTTGPGWQGAPIQSGLDCDDTDPNQTVAPTWYLDFDGDGFGNPAFTTVACTAPSNYILDSTDCVDSDNTVYPNAPELCDGQPNDCSNAISSLESDVDGDGYVACSIDSNGWDGTTLPLGDNDCDDTDPLRYPSATEVCDGLDNDCDGGLPADETDDDGDGYVECLADLSTWQGIAITGGEDCDDTDANVYAESTWYFDEDLDGVGTNQNTVVDCHQPAGYVDVDTDCDDTDPTLLSILDDADCDGTETLNDCDDTDPTLNDLDEDGDGNTSCDEDCNDLDASLSGLPGGGCPKGASCLDILGSTNDIGSNVYTIDPSGNGPSSSYNVYCDMQTDGGGWTALVNPQNITGLTATHPNLTNTATHLSGAGSCYPTNNITSGNGWYAVSGYACGTFTGQFNQLWSNDIGATDIMFTAALQGQQTRTLAINGTNIPYDAFSNAYMNCAFWNGTATSISPGTNLCNNTMLNVAPHIYNNQFSGNLDIEVITGVACYPDCNYGTGYNIQQLFVR